MKIKAAFFFFILLTHFFNSFSQKHSDAVKLTKWKDSPCDNTYDPYRLKERITFIQTRNDTTYITVNFSDNCCAEFKPNITFNDTILTILPYEEDLGSCLCDCCFSIDFEITGLTGKKYEIYFKKNKIELSGDHYEVSEPTDTLYEGKKINRKNKYGFCEGLWMTFYANGNVQNIFQYPEEELYVEPQPIWTKGYYASGKPAYIANNDTTEMWFEDGEVKALYRTYKSGDTTFNIGFKKFENRTLERTFFKKSYPSIPGDMHSDLIEEVIYKEEYYENAQPKFLYGKDTTYSWFENGQVEYKTYQSGQIEYTEDGCVSERFYEWKEKGRGGWSRIDLARSLYVKFYKNGTIEQIIFEREEPDGRYATTVRYYWKWKKQMELTAAPKKWKGTYPWKRFPEINVSAESLIMKR